MEVNSGTGAGRKLKIGINVGEFKPSVINGEKEMLVCLCRSYLCSHAFTVRLGKVIWDFYL